MKNAPVSVERKVFKEVFMNLTPWKSRNAVPFFRSSIEDDITSFQRELNTLMNEFFNRGELVSPLAVSTGFYPSIDLRELENKYLLDADVPGMSESDIDIDLHDNILTIKGQKKSEKETTSTGYVCVERSQGSFRRDIYLDEEVDQANIKADLKDGVLHVELLKKEPSKTTHKKIPIKH